MKSLSLKIIQTDYTSSYLAILTPVLFIIYIDIVYFGFAYKFLGKADYTNGEQEYIWLGFSILASLITLCMLYFRIKKIKKILFFGEEITGQIKEKQIIWARGINALKIEYSYKGNPYQIKLGIIKNKTSDSFTKEQYITLAIDPNKPQKPLIKEMFI